MPELAEMAEVEFVRRALVGAGRLPPERLEAWLASWRGDGSFLRHLVALGVLDGPGASTITAMIKGYVRLSNDALLGLFRLPVLTPRPSGPEGTPRPSGPEGTPRPSGPEGTPRPSGPEGTPRPSGPEGSARPSGPEEPIVEDRVPTLRPEESAQVPTPRMEPARRERRSGSDAGSDDARSSLGGERAVPTARKRRAAPSRPHPAASSPALRAAVDAALVGLDEVDHREQLLTPAKATQPRVTQAWDPDAPARKDRSGSSPNTRRVASEPGTAAPDQGRELPTVGDVVAGYQLRKLLGRGSGGAVFRAWAPAQGHSVVLKLLRPDGEAPGAAAAAHAAVHWRLRHPGVVTLLAAGEHEGVGYLVFEDLFAQSLAEYLEVTGPLPARRVAQVAADVADTLRAAERLGIAHGDLKPGNLLVHGPNARVDLTDFARPEPQERTASPYLAPERATGAHAPDVRADMYGLGATLYHAATGRPPFLRPATAESGRPAAVRPVHVLVPGFSRAVSTVISRLLERQPELRYGAWAEVVTALTSAEPMIDTGPRDMSKKPAEAQA